MKSIKGKVVIILILSAVFLGGLGYLSLNRLFQLQERISQLAAPNKKWEHFQRMTTDLGKLNSVFVNQGFEDSKAFDERYLSLIDSINGQIDALRKLYDPVTEPLAIERLDTIPIILDRVLEEFKKVKELRTQKQDEVYLKLENELLQKLSEVSIKDSMLVVDKISYEVRKRNVPDSIFVPRSGADDEPRNFFQRLFERQAAKENELVIQQKEVIDDTLVVAQSDTLLLTSTKALHDEEITDIIKSAFTNYYRGEVALMERIRETEQNFYLNNTRITNKLELLVNELQFEESESARYEAQRTLRFSQRFQRTIVMVISFFVLLCMVLLFLTIRDINKNKAYQNQILLTEQRALREARAKQDFLSTMSHELRTPLTSIIGYAEMLSADDENVRSIKSSSRHLLHVANEILDTAKVEAGIIEIKAESFDLSAVLHDVKQSFKGLILEKGLTPDFSLPDQSVWVHSDPHRLRQVLYNLLHNAVKFTEKGKVGMVCTLQSLKEGNLMAHIAVIDTGVGIEPDEKDEIFKQYQQAGTHKSKMQGSGLGLGIVKKVVELLNGSIEVQSTPGKGSIFELKLPFETTEATPTDALQPAEMPQDLLKGKHIYCLDDDPLITRLYGKILGALGATVSSETQPLKALEHLGKYRDEIDLVITDIKMPRLNGYELLKKLEEAGHRPKKILASTANVLLSDNDREELNKFDARIAKPINRQLLVQEICILLDINFNQAQEQPHRDDASAASQPAAEETRSLQAPTTPANTDPEASPRPYYSLSDFKEFAAGDQDFLKEIVQDVINENDRELNEAYKHLKAQDYEPLADLIHKMSARFAQLQVSEKSDAKQLELRLREDKSALNEASSLLNKWRQVNEAIRADYLDASR